MESISPNLLNQLPLDVLTRIMWHVMGRTSDDMGSVFQSRTFRDAYSFYIAYPRSEQYFRSSWLTLCLDKNWLQDDALDAVRILGHTVRCLILEYTSHLQEPVHELAQVCGNLTSLRFRFGYDRTGNEDMLAQDLTLMVSSACSSMRTLTFNSHGPADLGRLTS